jgi:Resolvase, N terminal domain/Helix-turn-helix domain of resolvase
MKVRQLANNLGMEKGDVVIVWKLDRLARSLRQLIDTTVLLNERGVELHSLTENINITTPSGKLTFHLFASLAEFERDSLSQRVNAGLKAARRRGRVGGRPKALNDDDLKKARALLRSGDYTKVQIAKELEVSRHTLWHALSQGQPRDQTDPFRPLKKHAPLLRLIACADPVRRMGSGCRVGPHRLAGDRPASRLSFRGLGPSSLNQAPDRQNPAGLPAGAAVIGLACNNFRFLR